MTQKKIDLAVFAKLWHAGETLDNLASRFGVSRATVIRFASKNGLPHRGQPCVCGGHGDPTPDQIAERARECRERHYAMRRAEAVESTWSKSSKWNRGVCKPRGA